MSSRTVDAGRSEFVELWGLPLTFALSIGTCGASMTAADHGWFELVRHHDPIDEFDDAWKTRAGCDGRERSHLVQETGRDPVVGHELGASRATRTAFHAAARKDATT